MENKKPFGVLVEDISGRSEGAIFQINWNKLVKKKGYIKIQIEDKEIVVTKEHLWGILFMLGNAEEQEKLMDPFVKQTIVTKFFKMIGITATKDIRKGELLNVPLEFTLNAETNQVTIGKGSLEQLRKEVLFNEK